MRKAVYITAGHSQSRESDTTENCFTNDDQAEMSTSVKCLKLWPSIDSGWKHSSLLCCWQPTCRPSQNATQTLEHPVITTTTHSEEESLQTMPRVYQTSLPTLSSSWGGIFTGHGGTNWHSWYS